MKMLNLEEVPEAEKAIWAREVTISFYGKKRGLIGRSERRMNKACVRWAGFHCEYYTNNPVFEMKIIFRISGVFSN